MISEKIELLGKGLYKDIPDKLTLKSIPTASELDYISSEDFDETMLSDILPKAVEEKIDFNKLLEIDYQWLLRCLRIVNYGPYFTTNAIYCPNCGIVRGEYNVNFYNIGCKPLPENFTGTVKIGRDEFIEFNDDVELKMLTIRDALNALKDEQFKDKKRDKVDNHLARLCYSITRIGTNDKLNPVEIRLKLLNDFSSADYKILRELQSDLTDYGLRAGGTCTCPRCNNTEASFIALIDDRYFRPTLGDLRRWKADRAKRKMDDTAGTKTADVRKRS